MANLYGILNGDKSKTSPTRLGHDYISSYLEDWTGRVTTELDKFGNFSVYVERKGGGARIEIASGNINEELNGD
jgi:hypothetical protein